MAALSAVLPNLCITISPRKEKKKNKNTFVLMQTRKICKEPEENDQILHHVCLEGTSALLSVANTYRDL